MALNIGTFGATDSSVRKTAQQFLCHPVNHNLHLQLLEHEDLCINQKITLVLEKICAWSRLLEHKSESERPQLRVVLKVEVQIDTVQLRVTTKRHFITLVI